MTIVALKLYTQLPILDYLFKDHFSTGCQRSHLFLPIRYHFLFKAETAHFGEQVPRWAFNGGWSMKTIRELALYS